MIVQEGYFEKQIVHASVFEYPYNTLMVIILCPILVTIALGSAIILILARARTLHAPERIKVHDGNTITHNIEQLSVNTYGKSIKEVLK